MTHLSARLSALLQAAGWFPQRRVDVQPYLVAYDAHQLPVSTAAVRVLTGYGGLQLVDTAPAPTHSSIDFDPLLAVGIQSGEIIRDLADTIGKSLTPVAVAHTEYVVLVADDGSVYLNHDLDLFELCPDIEAALEILTDQRRPPALHRMARI